MADLKSKFEKIPCLHPILKNYTDSHLIPPYSLGPFKGAIENCFAGHTLAEIRGSLEQAAREDADPEVPNLCITLL